VIDPLFNSRPPELTSDLEWMLQSGQATHEMLADALVQEFYPDAYRIAMVFLDDPHAARVVLLEAYSNALLSVYRYRSQTGARAWFFRIFIKSLRSEIPRLSSQRPKDPPTTIDPESHQSDQSPLFKTEKSILAVFEVLAFSQRLALFFKVVLDWPVEEIALAMSSDTTNVDRWLFQVHQRISEYALSRTATDLQSEDLEARGELLERSIKKRWPVEALDSDERAKIVSQVLSRTSQRDSLQKRAISLKEIVFTALAILIVVGAIWGANRMLPESESAQTPTESNQRPPAAAFRRRFSSQPTPTPSPHLRTPFPTPTSRGMFYELKPGERLSSVAARLGISVKALRDFNRLPADARLIAGDRIVLPPLSLQNLPTPTPVTPVPEIQPTAAPSSNQDIISALSRRNFAWQTLWLDAEVLDYGPPGFVGPPDISRNQLWLSQAQFLDLVGSPNGIPDVVFLRDQDSLYAAQPSIGQIWFSKMQSPSSIVLLENRLSGLFDALFFRPQDIKANLRITGSDVIAGRDAWRVDQTDTAGNLLTRFWLDTRTGFILRSQTFGGQDHQTLLSEVRVDKVFFDVNFPNQSMFDPNLPWRGGYASDYNGGPETEDAPSPSPEPAQGHAPLQYIPALDGFNPGAYPLTFQYPSDYAAGDAQSRVDVFSGMYYLGKTLFGDPRSMICSRSQDGDWLAYVSQPSRDPGSSTQLHLMDLRNLDQTAPDLPGSFSVSQFAFSPDNQKLAFFGYDSQLDPGGLYLMNLETGDTVKLLVITSARSLVWSPDGQSLGLIGLYENQVQEDVIVLDVRDGKVTFSQPYMGNASTISAQMSDNWPMKKWGVNFPESMGGLEDCVNPPKK
jgi:DNA-directed RNA polymerase specialized sigma24 family protein